MCGRPWPRLRRPAPRLPRTRRFASPCPRMRPTPDRRKPPLVTSWPAPEDRELVRVLAYALQTRQAPPPPAQEARQLVETIRAADRDLQRFRRLDDAEIAARVVRVIEDGVIAEAQDNRRRARSELAAATLASGIVRALWS